jgi:hypothetical protein
LDDGAAHSHQGRLEAARLIVEQGVVVSFIFLFRTGAGMGMMSADLKHFDGLKLDRLGADLIALCERVLVGLLRRIGFNFEGDNLGSADRDVIV